MRPEDHFCQDVRAMAIYQDHLDRATAASLSGDLQAFRACVRLPWRITTENLELCFETEEEFEQGFLQMTGARAAEGVTDIARIVQTACFMEPDLIEGTHTSHIMRNGLRAMAPYHNRIRLVQGSKNRWQETECANALINKAGNLTMLEAQPSENNAPLLQPRAERTKT